MNVNNFYTNPIYRNIKQAEYSALGVDNIDDYMLANILSEDTNLTPVDIYNRSDFNELVVQSFNEPDISSAHNKVKKWYEQNQYVMPHVKADGFFANAIDIPVFLTAETLAIAPQLAQLGTSITTFGTDLITGTRSEYKEQVSDILNILQQNNNVLYDSYTNNETSIQTISNILDTLYKADTTDIGILIEKDMLNLDALTFLRNNHLYTVNSILQYQQQIDSENEEILMNAATQYNNNIVREKLLTGEYGGIIGTLDNMHASFNDAEQFLRSAVDDERRNSLVFQVTGVGVDLATIYLGGKGALSLSTKMTRKLPFAEKALLKTMTPQRAEALTGIKVSERVGDLETAVNQVYGAAVKSVFDNMHKFDRLNKQIDAATKLSRKSNITEGAVRGLIKTSYDDTLSPAANLTNYIIKSRNEIQTINKTAIPSIQYMETIRGRYTKAGAFSATTPRLYGEGYNDAIANGASHEDAQNIALSYTVMASALEYTSAMVLFSGFRPNILRFMDTASPQAAKAAGISLGSRIGEPVLTNIKPVIYAGLAEGVTEQSQGVLLDTLINYIHQEKDFIDSLLDSNVALSIRTMAGDEAVDFSSQKINDTFREFLIGFIAGAGVRTSLNVMSRNIETPPYGASVSNTRMPITQTEKVVINEHFKNNDYNVMTAIDKSIQHSIMNDIPLTTDQQTRMNEIKAIREAAIRQNPVAFDPTTVKQLQQTQQATTPNITTTPISANITPIDTDIIFFNTDPKSGFDNITAELETSGITIQNISFVPGNNSLFIGEQTRIAAFNPVNQTLILNSDAITNNLPALTKIMQNDNVRQAVKTMINPSIDTAVNNLAKANIPIDFNLTNDVNLSNFVNSRLFDANSTLVTDPFIDILKNIDSNITEQTAKDFVQQLYNISGVSHATNLETIGKMNTPAAYAVYSLGIANKINLTGADINNTDAILQSAGISDVDIAAINEAVPYKEGIKTNKPNIEYILSKYIPNNNVSSKPDAKDLQSNASEQLTEADVTDFNALIEKYQITDNSVYTAAYKVNHNIDMHTQAVGAEIMDAAIKEITTYHNLALSKDGDNFNVLFDINTLKNISKTYGHDQPLESNVINIVQQTSNSIMKKHLKPIKKTLSKDVYNDLTTDTNTTDMLSDGVKLNKFSNALGFNTQDKSTFNRILKTIMRTLRGEVFRTILGPFSVDAQRLLNGIAANKGIVSLGIAVILGGSIAALLFREGAEWIKQLYQIAENEEKEITDFKVGRSLRTTVLYKLFVGNASASKRNKKITGRWGYNNLVGVKYNAEKDIVEAVNYKNKEDTWQ